MTKRERKERAFQTMCNLDSALHGIAVAFQDRGSLLHDPWHPDD